MCALPEKSPQSEPYKGGLTVLKRELSKNLEDFFHALKKEKWSKEAMSQLLRLHERALINRAREIGGEVEELMGQVMALSSDFANGQGELERIYPLLERLKMELWR